MKEAKFSKYFVEKLHFIVILALILYSCSNQHQTPTKEQILRRKWHISDSLVAASGWTRNINTILVCCNGNYDYEVTLQKEDSLITYHLESKSADSTFTHNLKGISIKNAICNTEISIRDCNSTLFDCTNLIPDIDKKNIEEVSIEDKLKKHDNYFQYNNDPDGKKLFDSVYKLVFTP